MRYVIRYEQSLLKEIERYLVSLLDDLVVESVRSHRELAAGIHNFRKLTKESRAILRLIKPVTGAARNPVREHLREASGAASLIRDHQVSQQLGRKLAHSIRKEKGSRALIRQLEALDLSVGPLPGELVEPTLKALQQHMLAILPLRNSLIDSSQSGVVDLTWLAEALQRQYRRARREYRKAAHSRHARDRHELRKRCKDLLYALRLYQRDWSKQEQAIGSTLERITDCLGEANDIEALKQRRSFAGKDALSEWMMQKQIHGWRKADRLAAELFRSRPQAFGRQRLKRLHQVSGKAVA